MSEVFEEYRDWLRYNGNYHITVKVWGLYGCYWVEGNHLGVHVVWSFGMTLEKHLKLVLGKLKEHKERNRSPLHKPDSEGKQVDIFLKLIPEHLQEEFIATMLGAHGGTWERIWAGQEKEKEGYQRYFQVVPPDVIYTVEQLEALQVEFQDYYYDACSRDDATPKQFIGWLKGKELYGNPRSLAQKTGDAKSSSAP